MANFKNVFSNRAFTGALLFVVFLYLFEEWLFDSPQIRFFQAIFVYRPQDEVISAVASGIASLIFTCVFIFAALRSSRAFQVLYTVAFAISSLVQYGFWKAVERFLSSVDLQIAAATPFGTWQGAGSLFFDWRFIIPVIVFIVLLVVFGESRPFRVSLVKFCGVFLFAATLGCLYVFVDKPLSLGPSLPSFYQMIVNFSFSTLLPANREVIDYSSRNVPENNIVLVIDESIRGDHLGINGYERDTTPFLNILAEESGILYNWASAASGATCSHPSNSLILTGVRPGVDEFGNTTTYPTVFQYAKAMGYETYYMDAQTNTFWNGLTSDDVVFLDSWYKARDLGDDIQSDFRAADLISQFVSSGTGKFIVLNKRGVHFLYEGSYPADAEIWGPVPGGYTAQPELVVNPYDNGVRYNVNTFFERLFAGPQILDHTIILYTSDHGQTLFENNVNWAHCNFTPAEATVPLILIGRNLPSVDTTYHASHSNILPTLLDLMGVPDEQRMHPYAPSLFSATADMNSSRFFFDGSLRLVDFPDP